VILNHCVTANFHFDCY